MAREKLLRVLKTWLFTPTTPPSDSTATTGTWRDMIERLLGDNARIKGGSLSLQDVPPTDLTTLNTHKNTTDGTAHGGMVVDVQDHGSAVARQAILNFTGSGVAYTSTGGKHNLAISGGAGSGTDHNILSPTHLDTNSADTPANGEVLQRVAGAWESGLVIASNVDAALKDGLAASPTMRSLGTTDTQAAAGNDSRFHTRAHSLLSNTDHTDVASGLAPADGQTLQFQSSTSTWVLAPQPYVSTQLISGLKLTWNSATQFGVDTGACYIPSVGRVLELTSPASITVSGLSASTWYYVYGYNNSGLLGVDPPSTTAPVAYRGTAKQKTGDSSRRLLGSFKTNASSQICKFIRISPNEVWHLENLRHGGVTPSIFRVTDGTTTGRATTPTNVPCAVAVPPTSKMAFIQIYVDRLATLVLGNSEMNGTLSPSNHLQELWRDYNGNPLYFTRWFPLDSSQQFNYMWDSAPASGAGLYTVVGGYKEEL